MPITKSLEGTPIFCIIANRVVLVRNAWNGFGRASCNQCPAVGPDCAGTIVDAVEKENLHYLRQDLDKLQKPKTA